MRRRREVRRGKEGKEAEPEVDPLAIGSFLKFGCLLIGRKGRDGNWMLSTRYWDIFRRLWFSFCYILEMGGYILLFFLLLNQVL